MPHQGIGLIGFANGRIARQSGGIQRFVRNNGQIKQVGDLGSFAEQRTGQHQRTYAIAITLNVTGGDHAAHRMADDHQRYVWVQLLKMHHYAVNVVDYRVIILNQDALALRQPVAEMVGAEHACALCLQRTRHVLITAEVLAVTVYQQRQKARPIVAPVMYRNVALVTFDKANLLFRHRIFSSVG
ncbi:hypothetical protein D3C79_803400 [compost metagenome]